MNKPSIVQHVLKIKSELGATNAEHLRKLAEIMPDPEGRYTLADVFEVLYPDAPKKQALERFKKFRAALNDAANDKGYDFRIVLDGGKSPNLQERRCWFEGEDLESPELSSFAKDASRPLGTAALEKSLAVPPERLIEVFVSYAHLDAKAANEFLNAFETKVKARTLGSSIRFNFWTDRVIEPGAHWKDEIRDRLKNCHYGMLLVSTSFLASDFIQDEEVPTFVGSVEELDSAKPCLPVHLVHFEFAHYADTLKRTGIGEHQIYRYIKPEKQKLYAWNTCSNSVLKNAFLDDLADKFVKRVEADDKKRLIPQANTEDCISESKEISALFAEEAARLDLERCSYQYSKAKASKLSDTESLASRDSGDAASGAIVAVDYLMAWAKETPKSAREYLAVLGEFGIGKTTTLRQFAQALIHEREKRPELPLPLVFDLRAFQRKRSALAIDLKSILASCLQSVGSTQGKPWDINPDELIDVVRKKRGIAIFDGLDEVMTTMTSPERQDFIRELWSILPPLADPLKRPEGRGRIIMSCRSHFFKDVAEQNGLYTGQGREGIEASSALTLIILPFTEEQIRNYLSESLGQEKAEQAFKSIQEIHNLLDLAQRPVLLNMIREVVPDLESVKLSGRKVMGVDLYEQFVKKHFTRDEGKTVLSSTHKLQMMEDLAAELYLRGVKELPWDDLETWFDGFLASHESIRKRYEGHDPEKLNQDLRNATTIVRPADSRENFRFAHTSLQEYFEACWMFRTLHEGTLEKWSGLPTPSDETLDFLGQLLLRAQHNSVAKLDAALQSMVKLLEEPLGNANLIAFRYYLLAYSRAYPMPSPQKMDLRGLDLYRWEFKGQSDSDRLVLPNPDFSRSHLSETKWTNVELIAPVFAGACVTQSEWRRCRLIKADFSGSHFEGTSIRNCSFDGYALDDSADWTGVWIVDSVGVSTEDCVHRGILQIPGNTITLQSSLLTARLPASSFVYCVSVDAANGRYLSGGNDKTVKVWDAKSLQCVATLKGHEGGVSSVSVDEAKGRYLSGGYDNTVKVWDAKSLQCVATLKGHAIGVSSVSVDEVKGRYLSGGYDNTVKVWDAKSLQCLSTTTMLPEENWVTIAEETNLPTAMSPEAGEHLMWVGREPDTSRLVAVPYEAYSA